MKALLIVLLLATAAMAQFEAPILAPIGTVVEVGDTVRIRNNSVLYTQQFIYSGWDVVSTKGVFMLIGNRKPQRYVVAEESDITAIKFRGMWYTDGEILRKARGK